MGDGRQGGAKDSVGAETRAGVGTWFAIMNRELRHEAARQLRHERPGHTLCPTDLVHEAYVKFRGEQNAPRLGRAQFKAYAARRMRQLLVTHAEKRGALKRGGGRAPLVLDMDVVDERAGAGSVDVTRLEAALVALEQRDARQAAIVELRFFGGLTVDEAASVLGIPASTAKTSWRFARAWLCDQLERVDP